MSFVALDPVEARGRRETVKITGNHLFALSRPPLPGARRVVSIARLGRRDVEGSSAERDGKRAAGPALRLRDPGRSAGTGRGRDATGAGRTGLVTAQLPVGLPEQVDERDVPDLDRGRLQRSQQQVRGDGRGVRPGTQPVQGDGGE
ncbi:hypothetical protein ACFQX6_61220 [Streptosporangium lutulentum]